MGWHEDAIRLVQTFADSQGLPLLWHAASEYKKINLPGTPFIPADMIVVTDDGRVFCKVGDRERKWKTSEYWKKIPDIEVGRLEEPVEEILPEWTIEELVLQSEDAFESYPLSCLRAYRSEAREIRARLIAELAKMNGE